MKNGLISCLDFYSTKMGENFKGLKKPLVPIRNESEKPLGCICNWKTSPHVFFTLSCIKNKLSKLKNKLNFESFSNYLNHSNDSHFKV